MNNDMNNDIYNNISTSGRIFRIALSVGLVMLFVLWSVFTPYLENDCRGFV